jgi:hypothetical protein
MVTASDGNDTFCSAKNLKREWRRCYLNAMGLPADDLKNDIASKRGGDTKRSRFTIVNLLPSHGRESSTLGDHLPADPWTLTAEQVQNNILEMAGWVQMKKWDYVSVNMPDDEASLICSTVTSFIPTTANEIESLRKLAQGIPNTTMQQHRMGIVQILMVLLKERVNDTFAVLQMQRSRSAVGLWQNPLQCRLAIPSAATPQDDDREDELDAALGLSSRPSAQERQQQQLFQPNRAIHPLQHNFMEPYTASKTIRTGRPESILFSRSHIEKVVSEFKEVRNVQVETRSKPLLAKHEIPHQVEEFYLSPATLQQESVLLAVHHDLDSVQQMEQRMVDITTLLSQFSSLVSEQQEFVQDIYEVTSDAKSNIEQGQEELLKAKETVKASKHYTAKMITTMGILLLVLHWIVP